MPAIEGPHSSTSNAGERRESPEVPPVSASIPTTTVGGPFELDSDADCVTLGDFPRESAAYDALTSAANGHADLHAPALSVATCAQSATAPVSAQPDALFNSPLACALTERREQQQTLQRAAEMNTDTSAGLEPAAAGANSPATDPSMAEPPPAVAREEPPAKRQKVAADSTPPSTSPSQHFVRLVRNLTSIINGKTKLLIVSCFIVFSTC